MVAPEALTTRGVLPLVDTLRKSIVSLPVLPVSPKVSGAGPATKVLCPALEPSTVVIPRMVSVVPL